MTLVHGPGVMNFNNSAPIRSGHPLSVRDFGARRNDRLCQPAILIDGPFGQYGQRYAGHAKAGSKATNEPASGDGLTLVWVQHEIAGVKRIISSS